MNEFIRRVRPQKPELETGIVDLLANLHKQASQDIFAVLAGAVNSYMTAMIRFGGRQDFQAKDIDHIITIWQIMLDAGKVQIVDYTPRNQEQDETEDVSPHG